MSAAETEQPQVSPAAGRLANGLGAASRVKIVHLLVEADEPVRQVDLADNLDLSEASISRSKQFLLDAGLVEETDDGLRVPTTVAAGYITLLEYVNSQ